MPCVTRRKKYVYPFVTTAAVAALEKRVRVSMRTSRYAATRQSAITAVVATLMMTVLGTGVASASPTNAGSWPYPNGDLSNTRNAVGSTISLANVSTLKKAWSFTLSGKATKGVGGYGTLAANPVVVNGVVYMQDLHSNVYALSLATGKLLWSYVVDKNELSGPGPNGVAVANGEVYGAAPKSVFALNATTGKMIWTNDHLLHSGQGTFGIQPEVADGRVYLASQYGHVPGGGLLLALNATTGKKIWTFKTEPKDDAGPHYPWVGEARGRRHWSAPMDRSASASAIPIRPKKER
jgi:glucose dehydrogenase